jgi:hypothetical protein
MGNVSTASEARLAEYRALYDLAVFRMQSLDRRVPLSAATLAGLLATFHTLTVPAQFILLVTLPLAGLWLVRTTIAHARSFEDVLRRIEAIEIAVNQDHHRELMAFQSSHPSRMLYPGGRTGMEAVSSTLVTAALGLLATLVLGVVWPDSYAADQKDALVRVGLAIYTTVVATGLLRHAWRWRRYRYRAKPLQRSRFASRSKPPT